MTGEQKELLRANNIRTDDKKVVWDDPDTLEVVNRRGRRFIIKKNRRK